MRVLFRSIATGAFLVVAAAVAHGSSLEALQEPLRTVAEDARLLEKGRVHAQQKALVRLGMQTDPEADKVLLAQLERYRAGQLPHALWLELFEAIAKRDNADLKARFAECRRASEKSAKVGTPFNVLLHAAMSVRRCLGPPSLDECLLIARSESGEV